MPRKLEVALDRSVLHRWVPHHWALHRSFHWRHRDDSHCRQIERIEGFEDRCFDGVMHLGWGYIAAASVGFEGRVIC
jgi:hypothetical protein